MTPPAMPELPEVETVRRGLQPVMEGARIEKVEARRGDLRRPLPKNFVTRIEGRTVTGLGRRAKYLLADLSSGEVLMMHLGMSGSFRVSQDVLGDGGEPRPGKFHHQRPQDLTHDHLAVHLSHSSLIPFHHPPPSPSLTPP